MCPRWGIDINTAGLQYLREGEEEGVGKGGDEEEEEESNMYICNLRRPNSG